MSLSNRVSLPSFQIIISSAMCSAYSRHLNLYLIVLGDNYKLLSNLLFYSSCTSRLNSCFYSWCSLTSFLILITMVLLELTPRFRCSGTASHQLSATALLPSPDGSRHPLDVYEFAEEDLPGSPGRRSSSRGLWECLIGCRHKVDQQLARRRVSVSL
jgi:hypothetical protein